MADEGALDLATLRAAVVERLAETSPRALAREIGISPASLHRFAQGGVPYAKIRMRIFDWWAGLHGPSLPALSSPEIAASLEDLIGEAPRERRAAIRQALIATFRGLHDSHPEQCPAWIAELVRARTPDPRPPHGASDEPGSP